MSITSYLPRLRAKLGFEAPGATVERDEGTSTMADGPAQAHDAVLEAVVRVPDADLLFDLTDLLTYFSQFRTVTGIQRVILCLALPALRRGGGAVTFDGARTVWRTVPTPMVERISTLATGHVAVEEADWHALGVDIAHACDGGAPVAFGDRSLLVALGANWSDPRVFSSLRQIRSHCGLRTATFIHDVVPLLYPQYCHPDVRRQFGRWIACALTQADAIVVNSHTTAADLQKVSDAFGLPRREPVVCRLNGRFPTRPAAGPQNLSPAIADATAAPYVLFVGTLEPRKDHLFVLAAWRAARDAAGAGRMPNLVLAGKPGWDYAPILTACASFDLRDCVRVLNEVSDEQLSYLYARCLFTVYNSHHEGWGLPVTESLSHGKVPVVPRHSALVESGAGGAEFFEPGSQRDFLSTVMRLVEDPGRLRERGAALTGGSALRDWDEISGGLCEALARTTARRPLLPVLEPGMILPFRAGAPDAGLADHALSEGVRGAGWHDVEFWGCWTSAPTFRFAFRYGTAPVPCGDAARDSGDGTRATVLHVFLRTGDRPKELTFFVNARRRAQTVTIQPNCRQVVRVSVQIALGQDLDVVVEQTGMEDLGQSGGPDRRHIGVGVEAVMACPETDLAARLRFLEFQAGYQSIGL